MRLWSLSFFGGLGRTLIPTNRRRAGRREGPGAGAGRPVEGGAPLADTGAHRRVHGPLPLALHRVDDRVGAAPDLLDLDLADVTVLQRAEALMVGAAEDEVARLERHHGGESGDDVTAPVLHAAGAIV